MYMSASKLEGLPIISLQTGEPVALIRQPVIDIATLELVALRCEVGRQRAWVILLVRDIRQFAPDCLIIDNEDELTNAEDMVRLAAILETSYTPLGKPVISDAGRQLGSVEDYAINLDTHRIQQLQVRRSLLGSWLGRNLLIDRTQIIDITPKHITVRDATARAGALHPGSLPDIHT